MRANVGGLKLGNHIGSLLRLVSGAVPPVKGFVWSTDGSRKTEGARAGVYGSLWEEGLGICLGRYATVFQTEVAPFLPVIMKFKRMLGQRNMLIFTLKVRRL